MPYGFALHSGTDGTVLEKSHNGIGDGQLVIEVNGTSILGRSRSEIREILNTQARAQNAVTFILEGGSTVTFYPDSAPLNWQNTVTTE